MIRLEFWPTLVFAVVMLSWLSSVIIFLIRKKTPSPKRNETRWERRSVLGIVLQGIGYAVVWALQRRQFTPIVSMTRVIEIALSLATMALAIGSVWFVLSAMRTLGKEWSFAARLVEGHRLVQEGPYGVVRNPIYAGMFGMMLATGLAITHWIGLLIATPLFAFGTMIRIRSEEKLLREAFGQEFESYARKVPALVPFPHLRP